jgi:hypothetical protein
MPQSCKHCLKKKQNHPPASFGFAEFAPGHRNGIVCILKAQSAFHRLKIGMSLKPGHNLLTIALSLKTKTIV